MSSRVLKRSVSKLFGGFVLLASLAAAAPASAATPAALWPAASELALPSGANATPDRQTAELDAVSCTGIVACVAGGSYVDKSGLSSAMGVSELFNFNTALWSSRPLSLAPGNPAFLKSSSLSSVACANQDVCTGVGFYQDGTSDYQALITNKTSMDWDQTSPLTLPSDAIPSGQDAALLSVSCTSAADCVATGTYKDANGAEDTQAMVATETNGSWDQAVKVILPNGAATAAGAQDAELDAVTCTSAGNCVATGTYADANGDNEAMVATETNGAWGGAVESPLPNGAVTVAGDQDADLQGLFCTGQGSCVAATTSMRVAAIRRW
jgi:hypothetical protein